MLLAPAGGGQGWCSTANGHWAAPAESRPQAPAVPLRQRTLRGGARDAGPNDSGMPTLDVSLGEHCGLRQDRGRFPVTTSAQAARTQTPGNSTELKTIELSWLLEKLLRKAWAGSPQERGQGRACVCETASRLRRGLRRVAHGFLRTSPGLGAGMARGTGWRRAPPRCWKPPSGTRQGSRQARCRWDQRAKADGVTGLVQMT